MPLERHLAPGSTQNTWQLQKSWAGPGMGKHWLNGYCMRRLRKGNRLRRQSQLHRAHTSLQAPQHIAPGREACTWGEKGEWKLGSDNESAGSNPGSKRAIVRRGHRHIHAPEAQVPRVSVRIASAHVCAWRKEEHTARALSLIPGWVVVAPRGCTSLFAPYQLPAHYCLVLRF